MLHKLSYGVKDGEEKRVGAKVAEVEEQVVDTARKVEEKKMVKIEAETRPDEDFELIAK